MVKGAFTLHSCGTTALVSSTQDNIITFTPRAALCVNDRAQYEWAINSIAAKSSLAGSTKFRWLSSMLGYTGVHWCFINCHRKLGKATPESTWQQSSRYASHDESLLQTIKSIQIDGIDRIKVIQIASTLY